MDNYSLQIIIINYSDSVSLSQTYTLNKHRLSKVQIMMSAFAMNCFQYPALYFYNTHNEIVQPYVGYYNLIYASTFKIKAVPGKLIRELLHF